MAESDLSITYSDLLLEVATYLGYGADSTAWTAAQLAELDRYVQAGVRQFYYPPALDDSGEHHPWSFLSPVATITTTADVGTQDLPDDLGRVLGTFHFDESEHRVSVVQVTEERLQTLLSRSDDTAAPQVARVRQKRQADGQGQRFEVAWWPIPDAAYVLTYRYEAFSGKLSSANPYPLGGMRHAELLIASCLAVAELRANDERGIHAEAFTRLLRSGILQDRTLGARFYGLMGESTEVPVVPRHGDTGTSYDITYKGSTL